MKKSHVSGMVPQFARLSLCCVERSGDETIQHTLYAALSYVMVAPGHS